MTADLNDLNSHRQYVEPGVPYDSGAQTFRRMLDAGLREGHTLLDVGAGSLRVGRFLMTYLARGDYYAIEPQQWLLDGAREHEIGDLAAFRGVHFAHNDDFDLTVFGEGRFDYVMVSSIFEHTSHPQMRQIFATAARALRPGGRMVADYLDAGGGDYTGDHWVYPGTTVHYASCIEAVAPGWAFTTLERDPQYGHSLWVVGTPPR